MLRYGEESATTSSPAMKDYKIWKLDSSVFLSRVITDPKEEATSNTQKKTSLQAAPEDIT